MGFEEIMSLTEGEKLELLRMWNELVTHNMDSVLSE